MAKLVSLKFVNNLQLSQAAYEATSLTCLKLSLPHFTYIVIIFKTSKHSQRHINLDFIF